MLSTTWAMTMSSEATSPSSSNYFANGFKQWATTSVKNTWLKKRYLCILVPSTPDMKLNQKLLGIYSIYSNKS